MDFSMDFPLLQAQKDTQTIEKHTKNRSKNKKIGRASRAPLRALRARCARAERARAIVYPGTYVPRTYVPRTYVPGTYVPGLSAISIHFPLIFD